MILFDITCPVRNLTQVRYNDIFSLLRKIKIYFLLEYNKFPSGLITIMATYIDNRKAHFNYNIEETFEAGIELSGFEVKAIKAGLGSLVAAFCIVRGGEAYIINMHIPPYQPHNTDPGYNPDRNRRLLLSKKEIKKLAEKDDIKGLTLIPISLYSKGRYIKVSIAVARGKKVFDKRETIKKRDVDREIRREYKVR